MNQERVIVYVDGFNLYYGAVKGTAFKWLNLGALCRRIMRPSDNLVAIKYYTALISARPHDPEAPVRQQMYLRALKTIPILSIYYGHFLSHTVRMPLATSVASGNVDDSDLAEPIRIVREELGRRVGILNPQRNPSRVLQRNADFFKKIRAHALRESQFPRTLRDAHGTFHKPLAW